MTLTHSDREGEINRSREVARQRWDRERWREGLERKGRWRERLDGKMERERKDMEREVG